MPFFFFLMASCTSVYSPKLFNSPVILRRNKAADCFFSHFTDEKTEVQRGKWFGQGYTLKWC